MIPAVAAGIPRTSVKNINKKMHIVLTNNSTKILLMLLSLGPKAKMAKIAIKEGIAWEVLIDKSIFLNTKTKSKTTTPTTLLEFPKILL